MWAWRDGILAARRAVRPAGALGVERRDRCADATGQPVSTPPAELQNEGAGDVLEVGAAGPGNEIAARSPLQLFWRRLREDKVALTALGFIVFLVAVAVLAPLIRKIFGAPPPNLQDSGTLDDFGTPSGPSGSHLFGVDDVGRDVFSRVLYGARVSLEVALIATAIAVVLTQIFWSVYDSVLRSELPAMLAIVVRNGLLIALAAGAIARLREPAANL